VSPTIEIRVTVADKTTTQTFTKLPIQFGREERCDVSLPFPFVSRCHAVLEARDGEIVLLDQGSTNGLLHEGTRLLPHTPMRLGEKEREFAIDDVSIAIRVFEPTPLADELNDRHESTSPLVAIEAVEAESEMRTSLYSDQNIEPGALDDAQSILEDYRAARRRALRGLRIAVDATEERERESLVRTLAASFGDLVHDPELQALAREHDVEFPTMPTELEVEICVPGPLVPDLDELASRHVPDAGMLVDADDVTAFLGRVDAVLSAALDGIVNFEIWSQGFVDANALAAANPGASLRARLLDWRNDESDVRRVLDDLFAEARERHERRMAEAHVAALGAVAALAPQETVRAAKVRWWSPFPFVTLWRSHVARYGRIADEQVNALWRAHCRRHAQLDWPRSPEVFRASEVRSIAAETPRAPESALG
jgi:hypothetical protein